MEPVKLVTSYVLGYAAVALLGSISKLVIEAVSDVGNELHWLTTMPFIALVFAFFIYRRWTRRASA